MPKIEFKIDNPCPKISYEMYSEYYNKVLTDNNLNVIDKESRHSSEDGSWTFSYNVKGKRKYMKPKNLMSHFGKNTYRGRSLVNVDKEGNVEEIVNQYPSDIILKSSNEKINELRENPSFSKNMGENMTLLIGGIIIFGQAMEFPEVNRTVHMVDSYFNKGVEEIKKNNNLEDISEVNSDTTYKHPIFKLHSKPAD